MNDTLSNELNSLNAERQSLKNDIRSLQDKQDIWDRRNRYFAIGATAFTIVGGLLAVASLYSQGAASSKLLESRPRAERLESAEARLDTILKIESDGKIQAAKTLAATANALAETEKLERIRLEKSLAARRISSEQRELISNNLKQFRGMHAEFELLSSKEANDLATDLMNTLHDAGWLAFPATHVYMVDGRLTTPPLPPYASFQGVKVRSIGDESEKAANELIRLLNGCGIASSFERGGRTGWIEISIGNR